MAIERMNGIGSAARAFDTERIERAVREIIAAVGEDPGRQGLIETPARVARMYTELFEGLQVDPSEYLQVGFDVAHDEMVVLKDIPFYSICEHHFMPFHGVAAVGYLPDGRVVGLSKLARVVDGFARRPQLQERLTSQIADAIMGTLQPDGVAGRICSPSNTATASIRGVAARLDQSITAVALSRRRAALTASM